MQKEPTDLKTALNQSHPSLKGLENSEEEEILTPEEIRDILAKARALKRAELNTIAYNRKLRQEEEEMAVSSEKFFNWVTWKAKSLPAIDGGVKDFELTPEEEKLYTMLSMYFTKDFRFTEFKDPYGVNYSLHKGLWFYGNWGCGKSTIVELFRANPMASYPVVQCEEISTIYKDTGKVARYDKLPSVCFDDLGKDMRDGIPMHMGTKKNVMAEIMTAVYKATKNEKVFRMHITTNHKTDEIAALYGGDLTDRLRQMVNMISLEGMPTRREA
jgi:hypothetical protein